VIEGQMPQNLDRSRRMGIIAKDPVDVMERR
jgi:hypothetical protein